MKLTIERPTYKEKYTFEDDSDDLGLDELHEIWEKALFSLGYQQETIKRFYNLD